MSVDVSTLLLDAGVLLLSVAALIGFMQARTTPGTDAYHHWRVVHNGGTAGAVQLIALAAVWSRVGNAGQLIALGVCVSTWAFFVGPLLRALGREPMGRKVNLFGALVATPSYIGLPWLVISKVF